jgi:hypothetical protein
MSLARLGSWFAISLVLTSVAVGCGGSSFDLSTGTADASTDTGARTDAKKGSDAGAKDASKPDVATADDGSKPDAEKKDAAPVDAGVDACTPLSPTAKDVYVDQRNTATTPTGTEGCPFPTILQGTTEAAALTALGTVTVHVSGATPALVYAETDAVTVQGNVNLVGEGARFVTISSNGTCGTGTCAVQVAAGGVLDGFTVTSTMGDGIVTAAGPPAATVRNLVATGSKGNGVLALGAIEVGPNIGLDANGASGLESPMGANGKLHVVLGLNTFDDNTDNGIDVSGGAYLEFEGGSASGNLQGIRLGGATVGGAHAISGLIAKKNLGPAGLVAYGGQTLTVALSTFLGNANVGLYYEYAGTGALAISGSSGKNVFGTATTANNNAHGGLQLCGSPTVAGASLVNANGDAFSMCPPVQAKATCGTVLAGYSDVIYDTTVSLTPPVVDTTGCSTTP